MFPLEAAGLIGVSQSYRQVDHREPACDFCVVRNEESVGIKFAQTELLTYFARHIE